MLRRTLSENVNRRSEDGLALITVLAVIAILSILVLEFSTPVNIDLEISSNFNNQIQAEYNARAGIEYAIQVLRDDTTTEDSLQDAWAEPQEIFVGDLVKHYEYEDESEEEIGFAEEEKPEPVDRGLGKAYVLIIDEDRKLSINKLMANVLNPDETFKGFVLNLLRNLDYEELDAEDLVDNIIDWMDQDQDGKAEKSSYYEYLEEPYEPRNSGIKSIHELLLIKGMTRLILFGNTPFPLQESGKEDEDEEEPYDYDYYEEEYSESDKKIIYGLCNFINTSFKRQININTAPREVLTAVFDDQELLVDDIIEHRQTEPFRSYDRVKAVLEMVSKGYYSTKARYISLRSNLFRVESIGEYRNARVKVITLLEKKGRNEITVVYQRVENMSSHEEISFIGEAARRRRR